jgi:hypothetical protein
MVCHFLCHQVARELSIDVTSEKSDRNDKVDDGSLIKIEPRAGPRPLAAWIAWIWMGRAGWAWHGLLTRNNHQRSNRRRTHKYLVYWVGVRWTGTLDPAAEITNQQRCIGSGLICDPGAIAAVPVPSHLSCLLLPLRSQANVVSLMGNPRAGPAGQAGCSKSVDPRISVSAYWVCPRSACQSPAISRISKPATGHSFGVLALWNHDG